MIKISLGVIVPQSKHESASISAAVVSKLLHGKSVPEEKTALFALLVQEVDWEKSNRELSKEYDVSVSKIIGARSALRTAGFKVPRSRMKLRALVWSRLLRTNDIPPDKRFLFKLLAERVDWERSNVELAGEYELPVSQIAQVKSVLRKAGFKISRGNSRSRSALWAGLLHRKDVPTDQATLFEVVVAKVDWKKSNDELSRETGLPVDQVSYARHLLRRAGYRIPRSKKYHGVSQEDRFRNFINAGIGEETDAAVAKKLGLSRERVRQVRGYLGLNDRTKVVARILEENRRRRDLRDAAIAKKCKKPMTARQFAKKLGCSVDYVRSLGRKGLIEILPATRNARDWLKYDWSLPNKELVKVLGRSQFDIGMLRCRLRSRHGLKIPSGRVAARRFRNRR